MAILAWMVGRVVGSLMVPNHTPSPSVDQGLQGLIALQAWKEDANWGFVRLACIPSCTRSGLEDDLTIGITLAQCCLPA